jgi:(2Fe-2S) ferredoxin
MADKIKNPADLLALAQKAKGGVDMRSATKEITVTVHMGTCGIAAGARDILAALMSELSAAGGLPPVAGKVALQQTGCAGLCDREPMITLTDKSGVVFRYVNLDKNKVRQIVTEHVVRGNPVVEFLLKE